MDVAEETASLREHVRLLTTSHGELQQQNEKLASERERYRELYLQLLELCKRLERGLLAGQKAERLSCDDTQLTLAILGALLERKDAPEEGPAAAPASETPKPSRSKPTGRKPLPEHLPKVVIEIVPDEVHREGLDAFERIGEEVCDTLERRQASLVNLRIVRPKFVRKDRERLAGTSVQIAEVPELPIERGLAGPGLLADTIVRRWADHLPLHRLERIYGREGIELARSTLCGWHEQLRPLVDPLVEAMWEDAMTAPYLSAPMPPVCWSRPRSAAGTGTSSWSWPPSGTCSSATRPPTTRRRSTESSPSTRAISSPTRTWSTTISTPAAR